MATKGHHCHFIGLTKKVRAATGKNPGDTIHVIIKEDREPRMVDIPEDFKTLLNLSPEAKTLFENLSFTNRKEYVSGLLVQRKLKPVNGVYGNPLKNY